MAAAMATMNWVSTDDSWLNTPPVEVEGPEGRLTWARAELTAFWIAVVLFPVMVPVMLAERSPLTRLTDCGPATFCRVASDERGCRPLAVWTCTEAIPLAVSAVPGGSCTRTSICPLGRAA